MTSSDKYVVALENALRSLKNKYKMKQLQLDKYELEAVIELITSNVELTIEYNDQDDVNFWNGIIRKLDPDQKYAEDVEKGGKNHQ